jgi:hypothetical protein
MLKVEDILIFRRYTEKNCEISCGQVHDQIQRLIEQISVCKRHFLDRQNYEFSGVEQI